MVQTDIQRKNATSHDVAFSNIETSNINDILMNYIIIDILIYIIQILS